MHKWSAARLTLHLKNEIELGLQDKLWDELVSPRTAYSVHPGLLRPHCSLSFFFFMLDRWRKPIFWNMSRLEADTADKIQQMTNCVGKWLAFLNAAQGLSFKNANLVWTSSSFKSSSALQVTYHIECTLPLQGKNAIVSMGFAPSNLYSHKVGMTSRLLGDLVWGLQKLCFLSLCNAAPSANANLKTMRSMILIRQWVFSSWSFSRVTTHAVFSSSFAFLLLYQLFEPTCYDTMRSHPSTVPICSVQGRQW